ncbi:MAG: metallophosphoesterase [Candidatus Azobacteroides sp.]|nr:metallophosphoesterase [Candidatus Azobacteroides sp.]
MISTIVIGDVHGSTYWKEVVKENPNCHYIFLGDYLDPYENIARQKLIGNLNEIIQLKKEHPDDATLLLGNHDLHYFMDEIALGSRFDFKISEKAWALFSENIQLFQFAFQDENYVFTHAGISHQWFIEDFKGDAGRNIAEQLNNPSSEQIPAWCRCGAYRGGKRGAIGGIFWADIHELQEPLPNFIQVVGHNRVKDVVEYTNKGGRIIFCDCLWNKHYLKIE